ncbi:hypothetical protein LNP25_28160 [Klebsiella variicola subsp. variicola]|nr:hypothetical protein [Klebsiella variicola subsp. variicola]
MPRTGQASPMNQPGRQPQMLIQAAGIIGDIKRQPAVRPRPDFRQACIATC